MSSRYEFLGSASLGQFIPRNSWFHRRDPRARLIALLLIFVAAIFAPNAAGLAIGFGVVILFYISAKLPVNSTWKLVLRALPFILIIAVLLLIFSKPSPTDLILFRVFGITVTHPAAINAGLLVLRFILLISHLNAMVMSLSTSQISTALFHLLKPLEKIGFPVNDLTMVIQVTLRYLPLVAQLAEKIAKAQASRGGDWDQKGFNPIRQARRVLPLIVPIIVSSLKRAETMALAMESRGFNAARDRSSYYSLTFNASDALLLMGSLLAAAWVLLIGWKI